MLIAVFITEMVILYKYVYWLTDWVIDWLTSWLTDWLTDYKSKIPCSGFYQLKLPDQDQKDNDVC